MATATGSPTKAQFVQSYNAKYETSHTADLGIYSVFSIVNKAPYVATTNFRLASACSDNTNYI